MCDYRRMEDLAGMTVPDKRNIEDSIRASHA
jgi:hypothetical protein